tara:strand:+ start:950 stop:1585 length:636 start_codon:yes stop_codon:yes gene_type:complete
MRATFSNHDDSRTDSSLIEAFYGGEESAFATLAERLYPKLKGLALSRIPHSEVGRYQLAEDLVQETLMRVARTKDRILTRWQHDKSAVSTWVGTILKNLILSHLRTQKNRIRVTSDLWSSSNDPENDRVENNLIAPSRTSGDGQSCDTDVLERDACQQAISALPQKFHILINMQLEGKSHREIASSLGIARSTVTYRIRSATKILKKTAAV